MEHVTRHRWLVGRTQSLAHHALLASFPTPASGHTIWPATLAAYMRHRMSWRELGPCSQQHQRPCHRDHHRCTHV
eukprot:CAMPEP_0185196250 /NCGR_PEP_ID=MMETSP1140-20130426/36914_1 /TAXON_ID=298111 /ORGANISM="Pavlova sp., Strain CCMP459" /LENGTH=74 /DNA_ID=CAMNT_0027763267 /DNA_START=30 /DNA_END=254 /DNA_ORIENTATION=-